jgi:hypothetical protein
MLDSASDIRSGAWAGKGRDDEQDAALVSYFIRSWQTLKTCFMELDESCLSDPAGLHFSHKTHGSFQSLLPQERSRGLRDEK